MSVLDDCIFTESAISGATGKRPGLQLLLERAKEKPRPYDLLLVEDSSRLSRDQGDFTGSSNAWGL